MLGTCRPVFVCLYDHGRFFLFDSMTRILKMQSWSHPIFDSLLQSNLRLDSRMYGMELSRKRNPGISWIRNFWKENSWWPMAIYKYHVYNITYVYCIWYRCIAYIIYIHIYIYTHTYCSLILWPSANGGAIHFSSFFVRTWHEMINRIKILDLGGLFSRPFFGSSATCDFPCKIRTPCVQGCERHLHVQEGSKDKEVLGAVGSFLIPSFCWTWEFHSKSSSSSSPLKKASPQFHTLSMTEFLCGLKQFYFQETLHVGGAFCDLWYQLL